ncbi:hypothetical protein RD792_009125 [Penstemon davidsonii]|uniref:DUF4005 domain-containing protein n=1 Tax=Penstemon davidsonii TaxID=160366 RepID=A0ABR0DB49_9LAMI|nr:hypothetical protein RD792_009125 [Penstemon davidsonii]
MGKASKWFRGLLGLKKPDPNPIPSEKPACPKKKWSFSMSHKEKDLHKPQHGRVAVAVAVKQTSRGGNSSTTAYVSRSCAGYWTREEWAAVMIQSRFRAYLSRRALRALKALVKLQALVRGHLLRKRTTDTLRQLQALVRAQSRARVTRVLLSDQPPHGPATPEKIEHVIRAWSMNHQQSIMLKRNGSKSNGIINYDREKSHLGRVWIDSKTSERLWEQGSFTRRTTPTDDERSDKILQVDTQKPRFTPKRRNLFHSSSNQNCPSFSTSKDSGEIQSFSPLKYAQTSDLSSPQYYSAISSKREETFTPTKSDGSRSYLSGCSDNPNYMAYTESSKAKARSLSVPKQRQQQYEKSSSMKRYSVHHVYGGHESNFTSKAYPGSGRLDRLGMPISRGDVSGFSGGHWHR